jgi:hypothetical protein
MRKVIYGVGVALLTFVLGSVTYYLINGKPSQPIPVVQPLEIRCASTSGFEMPILTEPAVPVDLSVVIGVGVEDVVLQSRTIKLSNKPAVLADLDIGDDIYGKEITIVGGERSAKYRIFERYRTSMTVMAEGPHLDLFDWRHFDSEWIELNEIGERKFRTLGHEQMETSKFPPTTKAELVSAVRKRASDWPVIVELAKTCRNPNDEPCAVADSSLYFLVEELIGNRWTKVGFVEVLIPMGC